MFVDTSMILEPLNLPVLQNHHPMDEAELSAEIWGAWELVTCGGSQGMTGLRR